MPLNPIYEVWDNGKKALSNAYYEDLNMAAQTTHHTNSGTHHSKGRSKHNQRGRGKGSPRLGGGGGSGLQGANAIPNLTLPNTTTSGTPSSGVSPVLIIILLAAAGLGGWYWWHKAHLTAKQDQNVSKK